MREPPHDAPMTMTPDSRTLYRIQIAVALASALLAVLTFVEPQWIERLFDASPDGGDGSLERWIVGGGFLVAAAIAAVLAWRGRRRVAQRTR